MIDAIAFKYRTGTPWMDLPEHFGSWKGAHNRLRKWASDGTWEKVFTALLAQADTEGDLEDRRRRLTSALTTSWVRSMARCETGRPCSA
ncbi:transposase [Streptomyces sp. NPDC047028]|uniref:transposase n=1 Tax=Streptomyces sp. NPDC047028 TaxID=3155793 RepID=UPI0033E47E16